MSKGFLSILGTIVKKRISEAKAGEVAVVQKTTTPLGLHQGSVVELPDIDLALAQADGSVIKAPVGSHVIAAVGHTALWGLNIYNSYLGDANNSFVQLVTDRTGKITQARLFCSHTELLPQSVQDWEFWLGSFQKDASGQFIRGADGKALRAEWGLIGWPQFQVDGPPVLLYNRSWSPGEDGMEPVKFVETITDVLGHRTVVNHEAMEYERKLTTATDAVTESLLTSMVQDQEGASVNVFIGIPLDHQNLKILRS